MKKVLTLLGVVGLMLASTNTSVDAAISNIDKIQGQLQGTVNQLEAQGYEVTEVQFTPINYFVQPEPPYLNGHITVIMRNFVCPPEGQLGPCILYGTAYITADEYVQNNNGKTVVKNVSTPIIAL